MKKVLTFFLAFAMAGGCLAQSAPSCEMTIDTLSGCAPFAVEFKFKSVNADTLKFYTGDGRIYWLTSASEWNAPVRHIYEHAGPFVPVVELIQWNTKKDSLGNDQRTRELKEIVSTDTVNVTNCQSGLVFKDSCEWSVSYVKYRTSGDTVVNWNTWLKVYREEYLEPDKPSGNAALYALIRYDTATKLVFGIPMKPYHPLVNSPVLMYDFSMKVGDSVRIASIERGLPKLVAQCVGRDSVTLRNGEKRAALHIQIFNREEQSYHPFDETIWIEGIGSNYGLFSPDCKPDYDCRYEMLRLLCYHEGGELLMDFPQYDTDGKQGDCFNKNVGGSVPDIKDGYITVSPNPASGQIRLRDEQGMLRSLQVFNAIGQEVLRQNLEGSEQVVNISTLAKGVYFLRIGTDRTTVMRKIVVE